MKNMKKKGFLGALIFIGVFALGALIVMLLWNWLIPVVIGWGAVGYWQAAGLLLLCKLLFGGFGKGAPAGFMAAGANKRRGFSPADRAIMRDRLKNMDADEKREYIRKHMFGVMPGSCGDGEKRED